MTDVTRPEELWRLLCRAMGVAGAGAALTGCCEVVSLGWATYRSPRASYSTALTRAGALADAEADDDGWVDDETLCTRICGRDTEACTPADDALALAAPRIDCKYIPSGHEKELNTSGEVPEGLDVAALRDRAALPLDVCQQACTRDATRCWLDKPEPLAPDQRYVICRHVSEGGCSSSVPAGRLPPGWQGEERATRTLGELYARAAEHEAAAVAAFVILARELEAVGAPGSLVASARAAARDEARHARVMRRLAKRHGGDVSPPSRGAGGAARDLFALAVDNAAEGLAGETAGALLALHQAECASDPLARRALLDIARDEAAHAALAWAVHRFCQPRLSDVERARVREAFDARWRTLARATFAAPAVAAAAGLPTPAKQRRLMDAALEQIEPVLG